MGYILTKRGMFTAKARGELINIVIYIILPCNIFASFRKGITHETLIQCGVILIIGFATQALYIALNRVLYNKFGAARKTVMQYATICNNAGFMGLPIIAAVFGDMGLLYGSVVLIPIRVSMWTAGLSLFTKTDTKTKVKTLATHPCIWAVFLGFAYSLMPLELPDFLLGTVDALGTCTTAMTMLAVGSILSEVELRGVLDKSCFYFSAIRLIAIPALFYGVLWLCGVDALVRGVITLSAAMPAATTTAMLSQKYDGDAAYAAKLIFVSTALSVVTLPIVGALIT